MAIDYRSSHIQQGKGKSYHAAFSEKPYRSMVWQFEKVILDKILTSFYRDSDINHLDFACGTGRILHYLSYRTKNPVGVDISPSMLEIAYQNNISAEIIEADLTKDDVLGDRIFNLITAFRFFPNAQPELRKLTMQVLRSHLSANGYLVFNNHKNSGSLRIRIARFFRRKVERVLSISEVIAIVEESGLEVVNIYHLCVFPASETRQLLPIFMLRPIEALLSNWRILQHLGENLIFVCRLAQPRKED